MIAECAADAGRDSVLRQAPQRGDRPVQRLHDTIDLVARDQQWFRQGDRIAVSPSPAGPSDDQPVVAAEVNDRLHLRRPGRLLGITALYQLNTGEQALAA